jgi:hypothetical protein
MLSITMQYLAHPNSEGKQPKQAIEDVTGMTAMVYGAMQALLWQRQERDSTTFVS